MTKQDAKAATAADNAMFGGAERQLPSVASTIDELGAAAPAVQAAIDDLQGTDAAALQDHETAVVKELATTAARMADAHKVQHVVSTGTLASAADDSDEKEPALKVRRVDVARPYVLSLPPEIIFQHILSIVAWKDVDAFIEAVPMVPLPPAFASFMMLRDDFDLHHHWPALRLFQIPDTHLRLALAALPAFPLIWLFVDEAWNAEVRLAVTLREVIDALRPVPHIELFWTNEVPHTALLDIVNAYGDKVEAVQFIICRYLPTETAVFDALARCVNIRSASFICEDCPNKLSACIDAVTTPAHGRLHSLEVHSYGRLDASPIVAWLQKPYAKALRFTCRSVRDEDRLAYAIATSRGLTSLHVDVDSDRGKFMGELTRYSLHLTDFGMYVQFGDDDVLKRLNCRKLTSLSVEAIVSAAWPPSRLSSIFRS
ncbi:hypothetical protein SDRG_11600 [Saprolegnia diclina VS20]|uniref:Uncharacterized protein n=1 Tax=Saprolegnia diclina (strain VS20) TaxID=1156394 RepID=T0Q889_SAPDV|nr:hypothetical protein SDRG_11600 [Saprolegnia diclina VS20]EQC30841.1 hypothetical protein SDRG_11600 [Saprolegnia diclina VS20]|eukprot:XP_008615865.1 hypothetical protein SDRG_11600 [Saprolegnia diclina VS20]